jgi:hypothetical protein
MDGQDLLVKKKHVTKIAVKTEYAKMVFKHLIYRKMFLFLRKNWRIL